VHAQFCDGLLLCQAVSALEHHEIEGITKQPKSSASYLHNIRKALEVLRKKKVAFPLHNRSLLVRPCHLRPSVEEH